MRSHQGLKSYLVTAHELSWPSHTLQRKAIYFPTIFKDYCLKKSSCQPPSVFPLFFQSFFANYMPMRGINVRMGLYKRPSPNISNLSRSSSLQNVNAILVGTSFPEHFQFVPDLELANCKCDTIEWYTWMPQRQTTSLNVRR